MSSNFPILTNLNSGDYKENNSYEFLQDKTQNDNDCIFFKHILTGKNLVRDFVNNKEADFFTTIVLKKAMYRKTFSDYKILYEDENKIEILQKIPLESKHFVLNFYGCVAYTGKNREIIINSDKFQIDIFWDQEKILLQKGTILANDGWRETQKSLRDLIQVYKDDSIEQGFSVSPDLGDNDGKFIVKMSPELFDKFKMLFIRNSPSGKVLTNEILCAGFYELQKLGSVDSDHFNQIKKELKAKGLETWEDENFKPAVASSYYVPINLEDITNDWKI